MIIIHNRRDYLESLQQILRRETINNSTIIEKTLGVTLLEDKERPISHKGSFKENMRMSCLQLSERTKETEICYVKI